MQDSSRQLEEPQVIIYPLVTSAQSEENFKQEFQKRLDYFYPARFIRNFSIIFYF